MLVIKIVLRISFSLLNALRQPQTMAENRPTDEESLNFAKALYSSIWIKFNVVHGVDDPVAVEPADYSHHFHLDIGRAVLSEQMFTRSFYKCFLFVSKKSFILKEATSALTFCRIFCKKTKLDWNYFKRFLRFSALIAEFFLYRTERMKRLQLKRAPLIWNTVFKKFFAENFYANGGWEGLLQYSLRYGEVYPPLDAIIDDMQAPYDSISVDYFKSMPPHVLVPETDPGIIDQEMYFVFRHFELYFASKKKPITPIEKYHEMDIPEDSESESSSGSSSDTTILDRLALEDAKKKTRLPQPSDDEDVSGTKKPKHFKSKLDQPSCSTAIDKSQDTSPSDEEHSEEDQASDESLPSLESEGKDSKKRSEPMDTSGSKDPTQTKQRKLSDS